MADIEPHPSRHWALALPTDWWGIPLRDPRAQKRSVNALVQRQFGFADADPSAMRRVLADLLSSAAKASQTDGVLMAIALIDLGLLTVPATFVVSELPSAFGQLEGPAEFEHRLRAEFAERGEIMDSILPIGRMLREVTATDVVRPTSDTEMPQVPELRATYWVFLDEPSTVLHMHFTSPFVPFQEGLLPLFDAIVSSLHVPEQAAS